MGMWAFYSQLKTNHLFCSIISYCRLSRRPVFPQSPNYCSLIRRKFCRTTDVCALQFFVFHSWENSFQVFTLCMWKVILRMDHARTCLILFSVPCVPGAHKLTRVFRVSMNWRQDVLTGDTKTWIWNRAIVLHYVQKQITDKVSEWSQLRNSDFLPKFIVSIKALRLDIVNCKETTKHECEDNTKHISNILKIIHGQKVPLKTTKKHNNANILHCPAVTLTASHK